MSKKEKIQVVNRFSIFQRIEHIILLLSFTTLSVTGVPQKFIAVPIADAFIKFFGGIEIVRVIHHVAAVVFILEAVYHAVVIGYKLYVTSTRATMLPGLQDAKDGLQAMAYNFGLAKSRPKMGRYSFDEKMEYWAMLWGWIVMSLTGFMLWNPIAVTRILPGVAIPVAKAAHGAEAILAVLAILIWHFYNVHLRHFNKSMFTGKLSRHEMEDDHGQEMAEIDAGTATRKVSPDQVKQRSRIYYPVAAVLSIGMLFGVYKFLTIETTSVTTLPSAERVQVYEKQTPTPIPPTPTILPTKTLEPTSAAAPSSPTWNNQVGQLFTDKCGSCHGTLGGLNLSDYASAMKGSSKGVVIKAGDSAGSPLVVVQTKGGHPGTFTADELTIVKTWIDAGALEK